MSGQRDGKKKTNPDLKMSQERPFHKLQVPIIFGKRAGLHLGIPSLPVLLAAKTPLSEDGVTGTLPKEARPRFIH